MGVTFNLFTKKLDKVVDNAAEIITDTTNFDGALSAADTDIQKALETLDDVIAGGSATWGAITGTLSNQTDLQNALDGKANVAHTHVEADITDLDKYTQAEVDAFFEGENLGKKQIDFSNVLNVPAIGTGDMLKSVYDINDDGRVDNAENVSDGVNISTAAEVRQAVDDSHVQNTDTSLDLGGANPVTALEIVDFQDIEFGIPNTSVWGGGLNLPLDEADGSTVTDDKSSFNHIFTFVGNAQISTAQSQFGGASLFLDGSGDYLTSPDAPEWDWVNNSTNTLSLWVKHNAINKIQGYFTHFEDANNFWEIGIQADNSLYYVVRDGGTFVTAALTGPNAIPDLNWHHVVFAKQGGGMIFYVDGNLIFTAPNLANRFHTGTFYIGRHREGSLFFDGYMDDIVLGAFYDHFPGGTGAPSRDPIAVPTESWYPATIPVPDTFNAVVTDGDQLYGLTDVTVGDFADLHTQNTDTSLDLGGADPITAAELRTHVDDVTTNPHAVTKTQVGLSNVTNDAQLKRSAGDLDTFPLKAAPVAGDIVIIEDIEDSLNKKKITLGALATLPSKSRFYLPNTNASSTKGNYSIATVGPNGSINLTFQVPEDFSSLLSLNVVYIPDDNLVGVSVDLNSDYAVVGEPLDATSETLIADPLIGTIDEITQKDISAVFTSIAASQVCGLTWKNNTIGTTLNILGIEIVYD